MRLFIRVYIRILPIATSARPQIRTSAFYPRPVGAKVPGSGSSTPGTFAPGIEWSWDRKVLLVCYPARRLTHMVIVFVGLYNQQSKKQTTQKQSGLLHYTYVTRMHRETSVNQSLCANVNQYFFHEMLLCIYRYIKLNTINVIITTSTNSHVAPSARCQDRPQTGPVTQIHTGLTFLPAEVSTPVMRLPELQTFCIRSDANHIMYIHYQSFICS